MPKTIFEKELTILRNIGGYTVKQRTVDYYFDAKYMISQWNDKQSDSKKRRNLSGFLKVPNTLRMIEEIERDNSVYPQFTAYKGKDACKGTAVSKIDVMSKTMAQVWLHPFLFYEFMKWLLPSASKDVDVFASNENYTARIKAGEEYRKIDTFLSKSDPQPIYERNVLKFAIAVSLVVFGKDYEETPNFYGSDEQQKEAYVVMNSINKHLKGKRGFTYSNIIDFIESLYINKYKTSDFRSVFKDSILGCKNKELVKYRLGNV